MAPRRFRFKRFLFFLLALLLLLLLLELNRFLPGGWPGGGEGGFRSVPGGARPDPDRVKPPTGPVPTWPAQDSILVRVVGPNGDLVTGWRVGTGTAGPEVAPAPGENDARLPGKEAAARGFHARLKDGLLFHGAVGGLPFMFDKFEIRLPSVDAAVRQPPQGPDVPRWPEPRVQDPVDLFSVEDAQTGEDIQPIRRTSVTREGTRSSEYGDPAVDSSPALIVVDRAHVARIELEMNGRPTVSIPVEQAKDTVRLPRGREIVVEVRDAQGAPVAGAIVTARYEAEPWPGEVPRTEPIEVESHATAGGDGLARVAIPKSGKAQVLVEAEGRAPVVVDLGPSDGSAPVEVVLAEGLQVPVRVLGADGKALAGAQVVARAVVRGMRVERKATTAADGRASVGPLGPGPVEVYANADGQAWAVATAVASSAMGTVELRLARGATLRLVVDDPSGLALEGVSVHATPDDDGPGDVVPPGSQPWRTDAGGVLVVEHLPERAYKMRLSLPGYRDQMLRHVWPGHVTYFATLAPNP